MDQREHHAFVLAEELSHLLAVLRLADLVLLHCFGVQEVSIDLRIEIAAVGHDDEREIARLFAKDLAGVEDHRKALAAALRVPEHTQLAREVIAVAKRVVAFVNAQKLVVLSDDLLVFLVVDAEVLDVVQQFGRVEQAIDQAFQAGLVILNFLAVDLFGFVVGAKPMKEVFPSRRRAADFGFDGIGQHDERTGVKELRDVFFVVGQVVVKGRFKFDVGVLQLTGAIMSRKRE